MLARRDADSTSRSKPGDVENAGRDGRPRGARAPVIVVDACALCTGRFRYWLIHVPLLILDMRLTCTYASHMSKMVQIRNVPEALHRKLKVRAADAGQTRSDFLLA